MGHSKYDLDIISSIREGKDSQAIDVLYKDVLPNIKRFVLANNGNENDAEDAFQEAVLSFYKQVIKGKFDQKYSVGGYLFTLSKYRWLNKIKKDQRHTTIEEDGVLLTEENFLKTVEDEEKAGLVKEVMAKVGDRCQELLELFFYHKLKAKEISKDLDYASEEAVRAQVYRCKKKLMELIQTTSGLKSVLLS